MAEAAERIDQNQIDIFDNDIDQALAMFCEDQGIDETRRLLCFARIRGLTILGLYLKRSGMLH